MIFSLAKISMLMYGSIGLFIAVAFLLVVVILIQKGKGGGVGAMFGGAGASSLLGTKTGDFLTWVTISLVALFLVLAVLMDKFLKPQGTGDLLAPPVQTQPVGEQMPVGTETGAVEPITEEAVETTEETAEELVEEAQDLAEEEMPPINESAEPMENPAQ